MVVRFRPGEPGDRANVVVMNNQSANSKIFILLFDWMLRMLTTKTFVPWDILWTMLRVAAAPSLPNGTITQLSPYFTQKPGTMYL